MAKMQWHKAILATALFTSALAYPSGPHVLHEKRSSPSLQRRARIDRDAIIPIRIALKQSNLDQGYDRLMEVSHPASETYGKHFSANDVHAMFAPADDAVRTVKDWLLSSGASNILPYTNKGWLGIDMPAQDAERLLRTEFYEHATKQGCVN